MARTTRRRPAGDEGPALTVAATSRLSEAKREFRRLLESQAIYSARRRGARSMDNTDVDWAFRQLIGPRVRRPVVDVLTEFGLVAAGALIGYGTTL